MRLSVDQLRRVIQYDPETGILLRHPHMKPVSLQAKGASYPSVEVGGHRYSALRLVWALVTGEWPSETAYAVRTHNQNVFDLRWGNLYVVPGDKRQCGRCRKILPIIAFYVSKNDVKRGVRRRVGGYCRDCSKQVSSEQRSTQASAYHKTKLKKYDLTPECYEEMLNIQSGCCAICKRSDNGKRRFAVDHCHTTGKVRGLLCTPCNVSLGALGDDPRVLLEAAKYLLKNKTQKTNV
jgi:hypothetical protein